MHAGECRAGDGAHRGGAPEVADGDVSAQVGEREFGDDRDSCAGGDHALDDVDVVAAKRDGWLVGPWFRAGREIYAGLAGGTAGEFDSRFAGEVVEAQAFAACESMPEWKERIPWLVEEVVQVDAVV